MNRDLLLITLSLLTWGVGEGLFAHFQSLYLEQLGAAPERIGQVLAVAGLLMTVGHLPTGRLVDRWGPRGLMWAGWGVGTAGAVCMAAARSLPVFTVGIWLYHLSIFVMVPLQAYLSLVRGTWSLGRVLTFTSGAFNLGTILGPRVGGWVAQHWGMERVYALAAALFVASTLLVLQVRPHPWQRPRAADDADPTPGWRATWAAIPAAVRGYWLWLLVVFTLAMLPQPLIANFLHEARGLVVAQIGDLGTLNALGATLANFGLGLLTPGLGLGLTVVAQAAAAGMVWWGRGMGPYRGAYFLFGSLRAARPLAQAQVQARVPAENRGLAMGVTETVTGLSVTLAAALAGALYAREPALLFAGPVLAVALLPLGALLRRAGVTRPGSA